VSLVRGESSALGELRKWDLAPLGAVLVVVLLAAGIYLTLATGGEKPYEEKVRAFFESSAGGKATHEQARLISVSDCRPRGDTIRNALLIWCSVSAGDQAAFVGCFAWDGDHLVGGGVEPISGCDALTWDRRTRSLISLSR
jgi:hypothetical protein